MEVAHGGFDQLVFWVQLLALVVSARTLGWVMLQIGLPRVIGELGAGVILGPSVFGRVWADGYAWFRPESDLQDTALMVVSLVGVALLLVVAGFETDLGLITKLGRPAMLVALGSMLLPAAGGSLLGILLPDMFLGEGSARSTFVMFVALALSVSSLAVVAKILSDMGLMRRDFGQITVAAGMTNDVVGWLALGIFSSLAAAGAVSASRVAVSVGGLLLFLVLALTLGQRLLDLWLRQTRRGRDVLGAAVTTAVVTMLGFGVITQRLGVEAVLGAFVAGVILHRSRFRDERLEHYLERLTSSFFAPIFFAYAGLQVNLSLLGDFSVLRWTILLIAVAIVAKFVGSYAGARWAGRSRRAGLALGAGLNARGTLEIVIGTVGLDLGVFNEASFTAIVLVPLVTSIFASIALRFVVWNWRGSAAEIKRLEREEVLSSNLLVKTSRILLLSRGGPASIAAAQFMHFSWPPESQVTVFSAGGRRVRFDFTPIRNVLFDRTVEFRRVRSEKVAKAVMNEAILGYGVIGMGVESPAESARVVSPLVDEVLKFSPVPVVVVRRPRDSERPLPAAFARAVVPTSGSLASRGAIEVASHLGLQLGTQVVLAHVTSRSDSAAGLAQVLPRRLGRLRSHQRVENLAQQVLLKSAAVARNLSVEPRMVSRSGSSTADELLQLVEESSADLVIMGANLRQLRDRPFLGHTVERVLERCDVTVAVVMLPIEL